jgi:predicted RND superfamily exporter protein
LLDVDTDIIRWFSHDTKIRQSYEAIRSRLSGITAINVVIQGEHEKVVTDPVALKAIDDLSAHVASLPEVGAAVSVTDVVRQIHAEIGNRLEGPLPESRAVVEQYLGVLGSLDYLRDLISDDRQIANILIRANANGSSEILELAEKIEDWWRMNGPADYAIGVTGIMYEFGRAENAIAYGQLRGLGLALAAIGLILLALFRSISNVLAALVPNILPIVVVYGVMGFLDIPLDAATVCVGSIALGIAVDDTIHFAMGWREGLATGVLPEHALEDTLRRVLFPLVITTVAVASGFFVLGVSEFTLIRHFGVVTGSVVLLCLLADLTLLPVLLNWVRSDS